MAVPSVADDIQLTTDLTTQEVGGVDVEVKVAFYRLFHELCTVRDVGTELTWRTYDLLIHNNAEPSVTCRCPVATWPKVYIDTNIKIREICSVIAITTVDEVIAQTTDKNVVALPRNQNIIASAAVDDTVDLTKVNNDVVSVTQ